MKFRWLDIMQRFDSKSNLLLSWLETREYRLNWIQNERMHALIDSNVENEISFLSVNAMKLQHSY